MTLGRESALARATGCIALLWVIAGPAAAGTTGKLTGRVVDPKNQPIAGASVSIPAYRMGAATDLDGRYLILNIPPGKCDVRFRMMGYRPITVQGVLISADNSTQQDASLTDTTLALKEIVVSARRPVEDLHLTSNLASVSSERMKNMPVQELQDVVNLQAGVVDGHFRGGRSGEVQYQVDGVSVNNPYDNTSSLKLDRSLLEEVQVISGTFDAEYGQAMSGVVNAVLKRGTDKFKWNGEIFTGGFVYQGGDRRLMDFTLRPTGSQNYQLSLSGPTGIRNTYFLVNARRGVFDDFAYGTRVFTPFDRPTLVNGTNVYHPTGDSAQVPLGYSREWSGVVKLTNRSLRNVELSYQAIFNDIDARRANYAYLLDPDGESLQHTRSIVHGLEWTHTLSPTTVYKVSVRQNYFDYRDNLYDNAYDARYDSAGPAQSDPNILKGFFLQGVDFTRFVQTTNAVVLKGSITNQMSRTQQFKAGVEFQSPTVVFGTPENLRFETVNGVQQLVRHVDQPPDYPGTAEYHPNQAAAFAQEEVEWNDLTLRGGLRLEYFDARSTVPGDLENPADSIAGAPQSVPRATTVKTTLAPRLGVSYPISERSALFFAYGHFYQMPGLGDMFSNADYSILARLQAGNPGQFGVFGNPDLRPEKTIQYQVGYKHAITDLLGLDVNMFYKDIRDLLGVEFVSTYTQAEYARFTNIDFGNVIGFTLALTQLQKGLLSGSVDYTWQMARGNSSDPRETLTREENHEDPRPRQVPLDWDQRHTLNLTVTLSQPDRFSVSSIVRVASGQPYTPQTSINFGGGLETNSGTKPASMVVDVRAEKNVTLGGMRGSLFSRVFNLFDTRFDNGAVFPTSGSPYYSRYPANDFFALMDPTRYYPPRRIEVGLSLGSR